MKLQMTSKKMNTAMVIALSLYCADTFANTKKSTSWQIKNSAWTKTHEKNFEEFIATLGKAKKAGFCHTTNDCLTHPQANPKYYNLNPVGLKSVYSDCADLPYILRAYFSWMNDLPFSYPTGLSQNAPDTPENVVLKAEIAQLYNELARAGFIKKKIIQTKIKNLNKKLYGNSGSDIRYNRYGNQLKSKYYVKNGDNINTILFKVAEGISTASFRTDASDEATGNLFRDTYPVQISRDAIKPGTVLYDPNGHIGVVYEVTKNGKIHLIDAHPDNSLTAITYGEKFSQTNVYVGGGFSNWRPFSFDGQNAQAASLKSLPDYSLEQFRENGDYVIDNQKVKFHEYVRNKLSDGKLLYNPVVELTELLGEICYDVKERILAVELGIESGLQKQNHPERLPENIYGTDGDWENFSSPSRDARLKASIREGRQLMRKVIDGYYNNDSNIVYDGANLIDDLNKAYQKSTNECQLKVVMTNSQTRNFNLDTVLENIYKLSFDPYHCVELRWGLLDQEALSSCASSANKMSWYNAEQGLRNKIDRDYSMKMDYSLGELPGAPISKVEQENISIKEELRK